MRIGTNPLNHKNIDSSVINKSHRVIIPIYIPNFEGYFKDSFNVLKVCLESLLITINQDTVVSLISNGSHYKINEYLNTLFKEGKVDRVVINKQNLGKMNAIITETRASFEEYITYSDADVFFDKGWLKQTHKLFLNFPRIGLVSMNPMPSSYGYSNSTIIENILCLNSKKTEVKNLCDYDDLSNFHESIGRKKIKTDELFNDRVFYLEKNGITCLIGAGHFCCTIRKTSILKYVPKEKSNKAASGGSEALYLDIPVDKSSLWRVSSCKSYVFHLGNNLDKNFVNLKFKNMKNFKESNFTFESLYMKKPNTLINIIPFFFKAKLATLLKKVM
jgi:hypothetical protein